MNNHGQSIIQSLVGIALIGIVSAAFADMMSSQNAQIKNIEVRQEVFDIKSELTTVLQYAESCCPIGVNNLGDVGFDSADVSKGIPIKKFFNSCPSGGTPSPSVLMDIENDKGQTNRFVTVSEMSLVAVSRPKPTTDPELYTAMMSIKLIRNDKKSQGIRPISIPISFRSATAQQASSMRTIVGCSSGSSLVAPSTSTPATSTNSTIASNLKVINGADKRVDGIDGTEGDSGRVALALAEKDPSLKCQENEVEISRNSIITEKRWGIPRNPGHVTFNQKIICVKTSSN